MLPSGLWLALDTSTDGLALAVEESLTQYITRQCLLAAILEGEAHPDDLLDAFSTHLGGKAADSYLTRFDE